MKTIKPQEVNTVYFKLGSGEYVAVDVPATLEQLKDLKRVIFSRQGERASKYWEDVWNKVLPDIKSKLWDLTHDESQ